MSNYTNQHHKPVKPLWDVQKLATRFTHNIITKRI